jgi:hypothetical protein
VPKADILPLDQGFEFLLLAASSKLEAPKTEMPNGQVHERLSRVSGRHWIAVRLCADFPRAANPVTALDIALEPDATMIQHAEAANARLRKVFPEGYALDATHRPHITTLQRFVRTADLDRVYAAVGDVLAGEKPAGWTLKAFKYDYVVWDKAGVTVILIEPTDQLIQFQQKLIDAVAPFTVETGTAAAFFTTPEDPDINQPTID